MQTGSAPLVDLVARDFVQQIVANDPTIRGFGMVDADPGGIDVFRTWQRAVPQVEWLGLKTSDVPPNNLKPLSDWDRKRSEQLLVERLPEDIMSQVQAFVTYNAKASLEAASFLPGGLAALVEGRLLDAMASSPQVASKEEQASTTTELLRRQLEAQVEAVTSAILISFSRPSETMLLCKTQQIKLPMQQLEHWKPLQD